MQVYLYLLSEGALNTGIYFREGRMAKPVLALQKIGRAIDKGTQYSSSQTLVVLGLPIQTTINFKGSKRVKLQKIR